MNNNILSFKNNEFGQVRSIMIDNNPWFVGKDIAEILGYSNPRKAIIDHVDEDDKNSVTIRDGIKGNPNKVIINESGLYSLILSSKLSTAKKFRRWVTSDVLPSIRKHQAYITPDKLQEVLLNPDTLIQLAQNLKDEQEKNKKLANKIEKDKPKVQFAKAVGNSISGISIHDMSRLLLQNGVNIGGNKLFKWFRDNGYLCKREGIDYNTPRSLYIQQGLFYISEGTFKDSYGKERIKRTTRVTGKGQQYFIDLFMNNNLF